MNKCRRRKQRYRARDRRANARWAKRLRNKMLAVIEIGCHEVEVGQSITVCGLPFVVASKTWSKLVPWKERVLLARTIPRPLKVSELWNIAEGDYVTFPSGRTIVARRYAP